MRLVQLKLGIIAICVLLICAPSNFAGIDSNQAVTIPAGTVIPVRMIDSISSDHNWTGQVFRGSLSSPVVVHNRTVLPKGAMAFVKLVDVDTAGRVKGRSRLMLQLDRVVAPSGTYVVHSGVVSFSGSSQGKKTAKSAGIGALVGGGVGALFGGGKGAAIGAGLGAGTGVATRAFKEPHPVWIGSESLVNFRLASPVRIGS
jgi:YMGG-like Gly-zipper